MVTNATSISLARQPILDAAGELHGFELTVADSPGEEAEAAALATANLLGDLGLGRLLGGLKGYFNAGSRLLGSGFLEVLPPERFVLELPEATPGIAALAPRCAELRRQGFELALDDYCGGFEVIEPLLAHVRTVKIDVSLVPRARLPAVVAPLKKRGVRLVAEKITSAEELARARAEGFDLFQGYFFAKPEVTAFRRPAGDRAGIMRLLALALGDADLGAIEQELKRQPELGLHLLKMASSAAMGVARKISSVRQALVLIGQRRLRLWLQLVMFTAGRPGARPLSPLLQAAATRARFMELAAGRLAPQAPDFQDHAFMAGMLSLADVLLGASRAEVVEELELADEVANALVHGEGRLGRLLALAEALEDPERTHLAERLAALGGLGPADVAELELEAFGWANNLFEAAES